MTVNIEDLRALFYGGANPDAEWTTLKAFTDAGKKASDLLAVLTTGATPADNSVTSAKIVDGAIVNADINASAAIAKSKLASLAIVDADVDAAAAIAESKLSLASDAAAGTASRRTLGTSATSACAGNDSRLSDTRTPTDASVTVAKLATATVDAILPWLVDVDAFATAVSHTGWDTLAVDTAGVYNFRKDSDTTQNDEINWDLVLAAGTWTLELMHTQSTNRGIYTVTIGGSAPTSLSGSADTIDGYAGSPIRSVRSVITGIVIPTTGKYRLKLKMATKNASSTGYVGSVEHVQFRRTA